MNFKKRILRSPISGAEVKKQLDALFDALKTCPYSEEHIHELARRIHAGEPHSLSGEEALQIVNLSAALEAGFIRAKDLLCNKRHGKPRQARSPTA